MASERQRGGKAKASKRCLGQPQTIPKRPTGPPTTDLRNPSRRKKTFLSRLWESLHLCRPRRFWEVWVPAQTFQIDRPRKLQIHRRTPPVPGCSDPFDDSGNWFSGEDVYQETLTATPSPSVDGSSDVLQRGVPAVVAGSRKRTAGSLPLVSTANTIFPTGDSCCYVATAAGQQDVSDAVGARAKKIARQNDVEGPHGGSPTLCSADADAEADGGCDDQELLPVVAAEPMAHPTTARAGRKTASAPRVLPDNAVTVLKAWMLSPEHVDHPYPSDAEKQRLAAEATITVKQVSVWFTNARKRLWLPLRQAGWRRPAQRPRSPWATE